MAMKVPAIVLAVVLSAASLCGQATVGYAGATAGSSTATTSAAKGINPGAGLSNKMAAAMGETTGPHTTGDSRTHRVAQTAASSETHSSAHSGMHSEAQSGMHSQEQCKKEQGDAKGVS